MRVMSSRSSRTRGDGTLQVKFEQHRIVFLQVVDGQRLSTSQEFLLYCIKCIEGSLENLFGFHIPIHFETTQDLPRRYEERARRVCQVCDVLEQAHPELNDRLEWKLNTQFDTRESVCRTLRLVRSAIFQDGVSWPKIIALFSFVRALVLECVIHENEEFVVNILYSTKSFARDDLFDWIEAHHGWDGFITQFESLEPPLQPLRSGFLRFIKTFLQKEFFKSTNSVALALQRAILPADSKFFKSPVGFWGKVGPARQSKEVNTILD